MTKIFLFHLQEKFYGRIEHRRFSSNVNNIDKTPHIFILPQNGRENQKKIICERIYFELSYFF